MTVERIGVVGCGQMGGGIAQVCALAEYPVVVMEQTPDLLHRGLARIDAQLGRDVEKGKLSADQRQAAMARISGTTDLSSLSECDLVVEAVVENLDEKRRIFAALDRIVKPDAILASNTSSVCIMEIAAATERRDRVAGMHFFNPVPVMPVVEVVKTIVTSDDAIDQICAVADKLHKTVVLAKDTPGFIVNLLLVPYLLDAIRALEGGVASRDDIDTAMKLGCGLPMGPLTLADFIGLDTLLYIGDVLLNEFHQEKYAAPPLLRRMVIAGMVGRKSGKGFYEYTR
ncbi:MAG: 3-hydroxybutyryl-CoA dehydrogenase [Chloroflexi bacterium]|jgi:3-hydroxybutyryl-CoA dehydrogenase|nr:3-hydroxybutyryl-CoA dehydrogenase [Chloroflexota bacterium]